MNRFKEIMDEMRKRAVDQQLPAPTVDDDLPDDSNAAEPKQKYRLPYSSDPKPLGEPWN